MLIIPAIDIYDGKCVRLRQGNYDDKTIYSDAPAEIAKQFADAGFRCLHLVDLQGAKEKRIVNWKSIEQVVQVQGLEVEIGGGIRTSEDIQQLIGLGAKRVVIGSLAAKSPDLVEYWINQFGADHIAVGMDVRNDSIAVSGWLEVTHIKPFDFILDMTRRGAKTVICTDISRDGMLEGVNVEFFKNLKLAFPRISIIASGGISSLADIKSLKEIDVAGVIVGKAIYEGKLTLKELSIINGESC